MNGMGGVESLQKRDRQLGTEQALRLLARTLKARSFSGGDVWLTGTNI
jgi:hypothetical protein